MKTLMIVGGVGVAGLIGFLVYRKIRARAALTTGALPAGGGTVTAAPAPAYATVAAQQSFYQGAGFVK